MKGVQLTDFRLGEPVEIGFGNQTVGIDAGVDQQVAAAAITPSNTMKMLFPVQRAGQTFPLA